MVYPATPLPVEVDLFLNGAWVDVTTTGQGVREQPGITLAAGRSDWASQADPGRASFTMRDSDGRWSPDNTASPVYGQYRRNIPTRVGIALGTSYLQNLGGTSGDIASSPNVAALNVSTQLDIRLEFQLLQDLPDIFLNGAHRRLAAKGDASSNGWFWDLFNSAGRLVLQLVWFDSGGGSHTFASNAVAGGWVPWSAARFALRTTLDTSTGTVSHYVGTTATGSTWTLIAQTVIGATSLRNSTTALMVGGMPADPFGHFYLPAKLYAFEMRSVIAGTVVANPNFEAQTPGATTWTDAAGRTWNVGAGARITNLRWRFHGELSALPVRWDLSGNDITAPVQAAGIFRRLRQGNVPLDSAYRRAITQAASVVNYWPMEDEGDSLIAFGAAVGSAPMAVLSGGYPKAATNKAFPCSDPLPELGITTWQAFPDGGAVGDWQLRWLMAIPSNLTGTDVSFLRVQTSDLLWELQWKTDGALKVRAYRGSSTAVYDSGYFSFNATGQPIRAHLSIKANGANVDVSLQTLIPGGVSGGFVTTAAVAGVPGTVTAIRFNPEANMGATAIGHVVLSSVLTDPTTDLAQPLNAWTAELAGLRVQRLCLEEGITSRTVGDPWDTEPMGAQGSGPLAELLQQCASADGGILAESRDSMAVFYRTRVSMQNQTAVAWDYAAGQVAGTPDIDRDDNGFANDVTVTSSTGTSGRAQLNDGSTLSVSQPPTGAGRYPTSFKAWCLDGRAKDIAGWRLRLSAVDEPRFSRMALQTNLPALAASSTLTAAALALDLGDLISVTGLPTNVLAGATVRQLVQGTSEHLGAYSHAIALNTSQATPWTTRVYDSTAQYDTAGSTLASSVSAGATSLSINTTLGPLWTTSGGDLPFDISVGGTRVTVTAISGAGSPQTFTVNAVSRALTAGAAVVLADPTYYEL